MNDESLDRLEALFRQAQALPPDEHAAFLDAACSDDPALCQELESLLRADEQAEVDSFLRDPPAGWIDLFGVLSGYVFFVNTRFVSKKVHPDKRLNRRLRRFEMGNVHSPTRINLLERCEPDDIGPARRSKNSP